MGKNKPESTYTTDILSKYTRHEINVNLEDSIETLKPSDRVHIINSLHEVWEEVKGKKLKVESYKDKIVFLIGRKTIFTLGKNGKYYSGDREFQKKDLVREILLSFMSEGGEAS